MKAPIVMAVLALVSPWLDAQQAGVKRLDGSLISASEIDATVSHLMKAGEVTGAGIAIFNGGKVKLLKAYGYRDTEKKLPLTEDSVLTAASFTKVAFTYLVMQLVEDRTLDLDKPVQEYLPKPLPDYPSYQELAGDPRYKKITARMLLSHTAGFPNLRFLNPGGKLNINFEPGSRYAYSGEGMILLQFIVETVTKRPLQDLMQESVFKPLGMTRTSMLSEDRFGDDYANGYDEYGRSLGHQERRTANAAGSMQTTLRDFTTFMQAMMDGKGLGKATRETMLSSQIQIFSKHQFPSLAQAMAEDRNRGIQLSYGLGWGLYESPYGKVFFKEGHDDGYRNYTAVFDKSEDGIVIMTNSSNGEGIFKGLLEGLLKDTFTPIEWEGFQPYNELPPRKPLPVHNQITLDPKALDRVTGQYTAALGALTVVINIKAAADHLTLQENDEPPGELFPEGELQFFSKTSDDVITFDLDAEGKVIRLVIHTGGRSIPVNRVK